MMENLVNSNLETGNRISFFLGGGKVINGTIKEKTTPCSGDTSFLIETGGSLCRIKSRHLDIHRVYGITS